MSDAVPIYDDACFMLWCWAPDVSATSDIEYTDDCRHERRVMLDLASVWDTGERHDPLRSGVQYVLDDMRSIGYRNNYTTRQSLVFCSRRLAR